MLGHGHDFLRMDELTKCASGTQSTRQHQTFRKWQLCQSPKCKNIWGNSLAGHALVLKFSPLCTIRSPRLFLLLQNTSHSFPLLKQETSIAVTRVKKLTTHYFPTYLKHWWLLQLLQLQKLCCVCSWRGKWRGQVGWHTPAVWSQPVCPWHFPL